MQSVLDESWVVNTIDPWSDIHKAKFRGVVTKILRMLHSGELLEEETATKEAYRIWWINASDSTCWSKGFGENTVQLALQGRTNAVQLALQGRSNDVDEKMTVGVHSCFFHRSNRSLEPKSLIASIKYLLTECNNERNNKCLSPFWTKRKEQQPSRELRQKNLSLGLILPHWGLYRSQ